MNNPQASLNDKDSPQSGVSPNDESNKMKAARQNISTLKRILPFLTPYKKQIIYALVALVVASSAVLSIGQIMKGIIDDGFGSGKMDHLNLSLVYMFIVIAMIAAATFSRFYFVSWVGERVVADMRKKIYFHLLRLSPSFYESAKSGDLTSRMNTDTSLIQLVVGSAVSVGLRNILLLAGGLVMMMSVSIKLGLIVLLVMPFVLVPILFLGKSVKRLSRETQEKLADVGVGLEETIYGIRTIQAFSREDIIKKNFSEKVEMAFSKSLERVGVRAWMVASVMVLVLGSISLVIWCGGSDVMQGSMTGGQLTSFIFYAVLVAGAAGAISEIFGDLQRAAGATDRIYELLAIQPEIKAPDQPLKFPTLVQGAIDFDQISFFYPTRPQAPALDTFNLNVRAGEKLAIVGPSGAGKSTLFQLLLRFYDPQIGAISIDGIDIKQTDPRVLRNHISLVPQDVVIFSTDAMSNIRMARPDATDDEVRAAAIAANADEFITALPGGYQTYLGEKGVRLSGGQKQRIGIARAMLRNTPILLLDEATSALDSQNEKAIQSALNLIMQNRTTIIIAHRLSTVRNCDRIIVMDKGRIVEEGSHDALVTQGGLYARLSKLQLKV
jgi:ATP-binding cassette subfamily B protein